MAAQCFHVRFLFYMAVLLERKQYAVVGITTPPFICVYIWNITEMLEEIHLEAVFHLEIKCTYCPRHVIDWQVCM